MEMNNSYTLPTEFEIEEELFEIHNKGDFRTVLSCFNIMYDNELSEYEKMIACLLGFYDNFESVDDVILCPYQNELLEKMFWFFDCGQDYSTNKPRPKLIDWDKDSMLITSAINSVAGKDIRAEENLHWWTFIGYYMAISDCALTSIVAIRSKIANHEKLEKHEKKFRYENPQYFDIDYRSAEDIELDDYVQSLWNGGGDKHGN